MVHSLELTSGERELVPGKQQSTSKKAQRVFAQRSVYLAEISSSPSLSPLAAGRAGVYQRRTVKGFERFSTLSFSAPPPSFLNQWVSCLRDSRSTNADDVKGAMGQKSERVQV